MSFGKVEDNADGSLENVQAAHGGQWRRFGPIVARSIVIRGAMVEFYCATTAGGYVIDRVGKFGCDPL